MTTAKELAGRLNGRQYGNEITKEEVAEAKQNNLVVCFGYSDDITEFRGIIDDEFGSWEGATNKFFWNKKKNRYNPILEMDDQENLLQQGWTPPETAFSVISEWCPPDVNTSWRITTSVPYESFNIYEDGDLYCIGCVFEISPPANKS